jgi:hypothetical protein
LGATAVAARAVVAESRCAAGKGELHQVFLALDLGDGVLAMP